jgi:hypothetical protein
MEINKKRALVWNVYNIHKMMKHEPKSNIPGRNCAHPEREDDARRHHNGPGANRTIVHQDICYILHQVMDLCMVLWWGDTSSAFGP